MKSKKLWLGMLVLALVFVMTVVGCKEEPEEDWDGKTFDGTTWKAPDPTDASINHILTFGSTNFTWTMTGTDSNGNPASQIMAQGTYSVSGSTVTFIANGSEQQGTISGKKLTIFEMEFTKQ